MCRCEVVDFVGLLNGCVRQSHFFLLAEGKFKFISELIVLLCEIKGALMKNVLLE